MVQPQVFSSLQWFESESEYKILMEENNIGALTFLSTIRSVVK